MRNRKWESEEMNTELEDRHSEPVTNNTSWDCDTCGGPGFISEDDTVWQIKPCPDCMHKNDNKAAS